MRQRAMFLFSFVVCLAGIIARANVATPALNVLAELALPVGAGIWLTYVAIAFVMPRRRAAQRAPAEPLAARTERRQRAV